MNKPITNIIICGVGGQGILLASDIICGAAFAEGFDVKKSEIHGMAQRGGSVISHIRFGRKVFSPLIEEGSADFILAYEKLEALRYVHFLRKDGTIIVNDLMIPPMTVLVGEAAYPNDIEKQLASYGKALIISATEIARRLGNIRTANIVLLGSIARQLDFKLSSWETTLRQEIKEKHLEINLAAFHQGYAAVSKP